VRVYARNLHSLRRSHSGAQLRERKAAFSGIPEAAAATGSGVLFFPSNSKPRIFEISSGDEHSGIDFAVVPSGLYRVRGKVESPDSRTGFWLALKYYVLATTARIASAPESIGRLSRALNHAQEIDLGAGVTVSVSLSPVSID
jgi:hypothetical protein